MATDDFRTHFNSFHGIHHHHSGIRNIQRRDNTPDKIIGSRGIDKVQFLVFPFGIQHSRKNGRTILLFHGTIVRGRIFGTYATSARDDPALIHHRFGQCGLTGTGTANKSDIFNFVRTVGFHGQ